MRTDLVELAIDLLGGATGGPFKAHVFQKVTHSGNFVGFIARTGADKKSQACRRCVVVAFSNNLQTICESMAKKFQRAPPTVPDRG